LFRASSTEIVVAGWRADTPDAVVHRRARERKGMPLVAPPGGRTAVFGTNPFAYGLPAGRHQPVVLDH
jgi:hypothetical protein